MKRILFCSIIAALCGGVQAETWYLTENNHSSTSVINRLSVNDKSYWKDANGTPGTGTPTAADDMVVPSGRTLREGNITSKANSVTIYGRYTHDGTVTTTWANAGIFIGESGVYSLNTYIKSHAFTDMRFISINGKVTILGTSAKPSLLRFEQKGYSNNVYTVAKLIGASGTAIKVTNDGQDVRNNTLWVTDGSAFKGDIVSEYSSAATLATGAPCDDGQYGGRFGFTQLDTPGKLEVGKNWTLGAVANGVVKAANVTFGENTRLEVMLSERQVSRLIASNSFVAGNNMQIYLVGDGTSIARGRYPILITPTAVDTAAFILKKDAAYADLDVSLEAEYEDDIGTLYLNIKGYKPQYVDATYGNDVWDGSTNALPSAEALAQGGVIPGPKKTLAAAMKIVSSGGVVIAAEGVYDEGEMYSNCLTSNRVVVPPYVTLQASGAKEKTIIKGKVSTAEGNVSGCWSDAVRCVYLNTGSVVKGFTLTDGRTCNGSTENADCMGGGVYGGGRGLVCDCVITNCGAARRGPNVASEATLLRCWVEPAAYNQEGLDFYSGPIVIDSVIRCKNSAYRSCEFVNCTFTSDMTVYGNVKSEKGICRNCLHLHETTSSHQNRYSYVYNSYFLSAKSTNAYAQFDSLSRFNLTQYDVQYGSTTYRPALNSIANGKGDLAMYLAVTNDWPLSMQRVFTMKDMYGTDRLNGGALDLGAIQHCEIPRYVDAEKGDDAHDGLTPETAKRTLKASVEAITRSTDYVGYVIHAAPGTYDEGEMFYDDCSNRVVLAEGMGLVADKGAGVTTIRGKFGNSTKTSKTGPAAVRCAYLKPTSWIRGFKLTGGSTPIKPTTKETLQGLDLGYHGGGVYGINACIIACEITGNAGGGEDKNYRGPGGYGGTYIGCYVHDNPGNYQVYHYNPLSDQVVNSVLWGNNAYYGSANLLNCSCNAAFNAMNWGSNDTWAVNCYLYNGGRGRVYSNCVFQAETFKYIYTASVTNAAGEQLPCNSYDAASCRFGVPTSTLDAHFLPVAASPLVDTASRAIYEACFPERWACFKHVGFMDQQRVYNGEIDVGGGEYDVRGDMAATLNAAHRLTVEAVSEGAQTAADGVLLPAGDAIEMTFVYKATGEATFTVSGAVTVTANGVAVPCVGGVYAIYGLRGTTCVVKVTNAGTTSATLNPCTLPQAGVHLIFR